MANTQNKTRSDERRVLKKYLARYFVAKQNKAILQNRLHALQRTIPPGSEAASEIEARIIAQAEEAERSVLEIMDILDYLPPCSVERTIMELRHIDCMTWRRVCETVHRERSPCTRKYEKGLDTLLQSEKVRAIIGLSK